MRNAVLILTWMVCTFHVVGRADDIPTLDVPALRTELDELRISRHAVGGVLRVDLAGRNPIEITMGEADVESGRPMTADCAIRIASVSKVFVGTCVLVLAGEGKVDLSDPISQFVSGVPNGETITLRQLANHRSGLFNHIQSPEVKAAFAADPARLWSDDELLAFCYKNPPYFKPGAEHHYSNANTVLLAKVIEKVTGSPWREEVRRRVIEPLGLKSTTIPVDNAMPSPHSEGYAFGNEEGPFFHRGDVRYRVTDTSPTWWGAAGCIISTVGDLSKAAKPLATGELLTPAMREELLLWTPADQKGYEYGFHIEKVEGLIGHEGDVPGFQTFMFYSPKHDATLVGFVNVYGWSLRDMPACRLMRLAAQRCLDPSLFTSDE